MTRRYRPSEGRTKGRSPDPPPGDHLPRDESSSAASGTAKSNQHIEPLTGRDTQRSAPHAVPGASAAAITASHSSHGDSRSLRVDEVSVELADLQSPDERQQVVELVDQYARHPFGKARPLDAEVKQRLAHALA